MDLPVELVGLLKHAGINGKTLAWHLQVNNCLPIKLLLVWVDHSPNCVNVVGLWRACSSLCSCFVCVVSSVMELLSSLCSCTNPYIRGKLTYKTEFQDGSVSFSESFDADDSALIDRYPDYTTEADLGDRPPTPTHQRV
jgi:hypothetical protein